MAKQRTLQDAKERMAGLIAAKEEQLEQIELKLMEIRGQLAAAEQAMKKATEQMDVDAYEAAQAAKRKAQIALDMYAGRQKQIQAQEYISETESDAVIDSLLEHEDQLAASFKAAAAKLLKELAVLQQDYADGVQETESTIRDWVQRIHANYRSSTAKYYDKSTGSYTNRSPHPVPVHVGNYTGCKEASEIRDFLEKVSGLLKEEG